MLPIWCLLLAAATLCTVQTLRPSLWQRMICLLTAALAGLTAFAAPMPAAWLLSVLPAALWALTPPPLCGGVRMLPPVSLGVRQPPLAMCCCFSAGRRFNASALFFVYNLYYLACTITLLRFSYPAPPLRVLCSKGSAAARIPFLLLSLRRSFSKETAAFLADKGGPKYAAAPAYLLLRLLFLPNGAAWRRLAY